MNPYREFFVVWTSGSSFRTALGDCVGARSRTPPTGVLPFPYNLVRFVRAISFSPVFTPTACIENQMNRPLHAEKERELNPHTGVTRTSTVLFLLMTCAYPEM